MSNKKAEELNNDILNKELVCSSDSSDEYSFVVGKGKDMKKVIVKLNISPNEDISNKSIAKGLVQYINAFEKIIVSQYENKNAII